MHKHWIHAIAAVGLALALVAAPAGRAADETVTTTPNGNETTVAEDVIPFEPDATAGLDSAGGQDLINVTVENETLENVVSMFARISGANIVTTSADLEGTVTVNLSGVEWKPALSSILDVHDLALVEKLPGSGVYSIMPRPADAAEPLIVETVFLKFTTVTELAPLVRSMLATPPPPPQGDPGEAAAPVGPVPSVTEFASRNAIVVKTTEANMAEILKLISDMDVPGKQVVVETKFMELTDEASKQLGIRWDALEEFDVQLGLGPLSYTRDIEREATRENTLSRSDTRTITDNDNRANNFSDSSQEFFRSDGSQFENVETEFIETPPDSGNFEILETVLPTRTVSHLSSDGSTYDNTRVIAESDTTDIMDNFSKLITESQAAVLDFETMNIVLSALKKTDGVSVISNPKIIVASGSEDAYFTVGDREPIIKTEIQRGTQDSPGDVITAELDTSINTDYISDGYLETGIHLQVVPVVKTEDLIEASIQPKLVRRILPDKHVGENSWPRISVKEIKTKFTLRSGQTVAIGGLTDTSDDDKVSKVPLLGDIPLLGKYLFSHTKSVQRQIETIIFVTLSLAQAESLYREAGIPEDAELVHGKLIEQTQRRAEFEADLEELREESEAEAEQRVRSRLLKRRK